MDVMAFISSMLAAGIRMGIPIAFAGIGVVIAEKSGVLNIGCEGEMLTGSFVTFVVVYFTHSYFLGILAGGAGGLLTAMIISFLSITRKQDQSVVGIVVNIFAAGFTSFIYRVIFGTSGSGLSIDVMSTIKIPVLGDIPFIGNIFFNQTILYYALIVVAVVCWFVLMKLKAGLQLRAIGENPRAAQACGINVILYRHIAVMLAGFLSGIGGAYLVVATMGSFVEEMSAGRGFIAMAVSTLCHWNPILALIASFVFGIAQGLQMRMQAYADEGYDLIIGHGSEFTEAAVTVAGDYPDTYFFCTNKCPDGVEPPANLGFCYTKEYEAAYACGVAAAMSTESKVVGYLGGMEQSSQIADKNAFIDGVASVDPDIKVITVMSGTFTDSALGKEAALSMIEQKADVLMHSCDTTGLGLIEACTENNVKWIGYGADQVDLGSDLCITSCIADTGKAIEEVITKVGTDEFGTSWMPGMADDVVFVGTFGDNVPDEVKSAVEDTCEKIKSGEIVVENKETDN